MRDRRAAMREHRKARAQPVLEALDRAAARWDPMTYFELADVVGYEGEPVTDETEEERKRRLNEARGRVFEQVHADISVAMRLPDPEVRKYVAHALWQNAMRYRNEFYEPKEPKDLGEAYRKVESWMFEL